MANAKRDQNYVPVMSAVLESDGATVINITADPTSHSLDVDDNSTGTDSGPANGVKDGNYVTTLVAISADDGVTPVVLYADANGLLFIDHT